MWVVWETVKESRLLQLATAEEEAMATAREEAASEEEGEEVFFFKDMHIWTIFMIGRTRLGATKGNFLAIPRLAPELSYIGKVYLTPG